MQRRQFAKLLPAIAALLGLPTVVRATPTETDYYLAKIRLSPGSVDIYFPKGLSGVTGEITDSNICRLRHESFSESTTFVQATLIERSDQEATTMVAVGDGICDVYCYGIDGQRQGNFYFQIRIDIEP